MRSFAKKPKATQQPASVKSLKSSRSFVGQCPNVSTILHASSHKSVYPGSQISKQPKLKDHAQNTDGNLQNQLNQSKGGGSALPDETRAFFEQRMQFSFGKVRIHTDNEAIQMNRQLNARAFTYGRDIFFGAAQYNPDSHNGKRLLAHELTHVIQQNNAKQNLNNNFNLPHINLEASPSVMRQILLKIIKFPGSTMIPNVDVGVADHIYDQCDISVSADINDLAENYFPNEDPLSDVDVNPLDALGGDTTLDFDSAAEVAAVKRRANASGRSEVPVAYVEDILCNRRRGYSGYTLHGLVAVSNRSSQPHVLAHEVGHFFHLVHAGHGSRDLMYEDPETISYDQSRPPRLLRPDCDTVDSRIQTKLTFSTPGDRYEQEADRVADQVMQQKMPEQETELPDIQTKASQHTAIGRRKASDTFKNRLSRSKGSGNSLSAQVRHFIEPRMRFDFSTIRVHTDNQAAWMNQELEARAFTHGQDIYFAANQYNPQSFAGKRLLAHELTHTIQQSSANQTIQLSPSSEGVALSAASDPRWRFQSNRVAPGLQMNPAFWQVIYTLTRPYPNYATMDFAQDNQQTAYQRALDYVRRNRQWRGARATSITVTLAQNVTASGAAQDLIAAPNLYAFECYTAASLLQFIGVLRGLQQSNPANAEQTFNSSHANFRLVLPGLPGQDPQLHMGAGQIQYNLQQLGTFTLRELRDDPQDRGLLRGDWALLDNGSVIASGAFRRENATYLGNNRFYGLGIDIHGSGSSLFTIDEYAADLARRRGVRLTVDQILDSVTVRPEYRAP